MSIPQSAGGPITGKADLIEHLSSGSKPREQWRIGTEHEKFVYDLKTFRPVPYEGPKGIQALLQGMTRFGWQPVKEGEHIIGATMNGASLSLEPGGQFELSGAALKTVHETCAETNLHLEQTRTVAGELGLGVIGIGFAPTWSLDEVPVMPKGRYDIMRRYMPRVGGLGLEIAHMRQRLIETLDDDVQAVCRSAIGRLGADPRHWPDRRHHGHLVLHRIEDDDQRRPHENAVGQAE